MIARLKNHKTDLGRILAVDHELDIRAGQIWDNKNEATSWTDRNKDNVEFKTELGGDIKYLLQIEGNVAGYEVQYFDYDELEELGLEEDEIDELLEDEVYEELMNLLGTDADFKDEAEVLVPRDTKLIITEVEDARDDTGYIHVTLREVF